MSARDLREALTAAGTPALLPKIISPLLLEYQRRYSPLTRAIPSMKWDGDVYYFNQRTVNPNGGFVSEAGARVVSNSTYAQNTFQMKHLQVVGAITGYSEMVTRQVIGDLRAREIEGSIQGLAWDVEHALLWGNSGSTQYGAYPQFDGLDSQINSYSGSTQNSLDKAGNSLTLAMLDELADMVESNAAMSVFDSSWMFVMSNTAVSKVSQLLVNQQRFNDQVEVAAGLNVPSYRGIPLIKSSFLSTRGITMGTVTATAGTPSGVTGTLTAGTYQYKLAPVIARQAETVCSAEVSATVTSGQSVTLAFSTPTGLDGLQPTLYKVYRTAMGGAANTESLLGYVDATVGLSADGITPVLTTSIIDTGATLVPANGSTLPATFPASYQGTNTNKFPQEKFDGSGNRTGNSLNPTEGIYLMSRDENFICRPYVRDSEPIDLFPTTSSPDSLPYALATDCTLAVRAPKYLGCLQRVVTAV